MFWNQDKRYENLRNLFTQILAIENSGQATTVSTTRVDWFKSFDLNQWYKSWFKSSNKNKKHVVLDLYVISMTHLFSILIGFHIAYTVLV